MRTPCSAYTSARALPNFFRVDSTPRLVGITVLSFFFALGSVIAGVTCVALLAPGSWLSFLWRFNPAARVAFYALGAWALILMLGVALACAFAARGLWVRAVWGRRLAVVLLAINLIGDVLNAFIRGDLRMLIGIPIGAALIAYLSSGRVRSHFRSLQAAA